jgi:hypothetical protein
MDIGYDSEGDYHADFTKETTMPNIWSINDHEDNEDDFKPEEDSKKQDDDSKDDKEDSSDTKDAIVSGNLEDDLEKPSFLRRLSRKKKEDKDSKDEDKSEDK